MDAETLRAAALGGARRVQVLQRRREEHPARDQQKHTNTHMHLHPLHTVIILLPPPHVIIPYAHKHPPNLPQEKSNPTPSAVCLSSRPFELVVKRSVRRPLLLCSAA